MRLHLGPPVALHLGGSASRRCRSRRRSVPPVTAPVAAYSQPPRARSVRSLRGRELRVGPMRQQGAAPRDGAAPLGMRRADAGGAAPPHGGGGREATSGQRAGGCAAWLPGASGPPPVSSPFPITRAALSLATSLSPPTSAFSNSGGHCSA
ncbi:hypothetical protein C2845_PM02G18280 [Panicum miliaceum]|uniref:Uncharacterized protein n=1 Tax=Panicum miliaceum TaxID=4540 RepID=A0A3L6SBE2_PANMI|nr:hypothetical protein C2845_PM02G18280 [Panicum miliaceum]